MPPDCACAIDLCCVYAKLTLYFMVFFMVSLRDMRKIILVALLAIFAGHGVMADPALSVYAVDGTELRTFSLEELRDMPQVTITTSNEFVDQKSDFRGPLARDVLEHIKDHHFDEVMLKAANDYTIEIDVEEFYRYDVILALTVDGKELSVRDKGPIWIIYPMSQFRELQDPVFNNRLIWQLIRMDEL